jgi:hypothetical protein
MNNCVMTQSLLASSPCRARNVRLRSQLIRSQLIRSLLIQSQLIRSSPTYWPLLLGSLIALLDELYLLIFPRTSPFRLNVDRVEPKLS